MPPAPVCVWEDVCGRMCVGGCVWEDVCRRMCVGGCVWEDVCGRMCVGGGLVSSDALSKPKQDWRCLR